MRTKLRAMIAVGLGLWQLAIALPGSDVAL
jgi:hypothetical protein